MSSHIAPIAILIAFLMHTGLGAQTVVENTNVVFEFEHSLASAVNPHVGTIQQTLDLDPTSVWLDYVDGTLTFHSGNIDGGSDWYLAHRGDPLTFLTRRDTSLFTRIGAQVPVETTEFYLAIVTEGEGFLEYLEAPGGVLRNVFGWVKLRDVGGRLEVLESAVAYNSRGIIVGSTELIPEPSSTALACLAFVCLGFRTLFRADG